MKRQIQGQGWTEGLHKKRFFLTLYTSAMQRHVSFADCYGKFVVSL